MVKVSGRATVKGKPVTIGAVSFQPVDINQGRPARGNLDADGRFTASSIDPNDGLIPGEYRVAIFGPKGSPPPGEQWVRVPARYEDGTTSGFTITVKKGDPPQFLELNLDE
jgi:hypothetical protein